MRWQRTNERGSNYNTTTAVAEVVVAAVNKEYERLKRTESRGRKKLSRKSRVPWPSTRRLTSQLGGQVLDREESIFNQQTLKE
jgi:hypothetical protein